MKVPIRTLELTQIQPLYILGSGKGAQLQLNFCDDGAETFGDTLGPPAEAGPTRACRHCDLAALQPYTPRKHCILATVPCKIVLSSSPLRSQTGRSTAWRRSRTLR
jgi:hypothetical protein